jgi:PAS domain S-box-containing protein
VKISGRTIAVTLKVFFPVWCIVALVTIFFYRQQLNSLRTDVLSEQRNSTLMITSIIEDDLKVPFAELKRLLADPATVDALEGDSTEKSMAIRRLAHGYLHLIAATELYDQLRIIDAAGNEVVRVDYRDGNPTVVPDGKLQNKAGRYYFQDTLNLSAGDVYISPFDLNIERGKLEQPLKPMIRIATPIFGENGDKLGILIINYLGKRLLEQIRKYGASAFTGTEMLNADGFWLSSDSSANEWAFMYPDRKQITFGKSFPDAWKTMQATRSGQFENENGVFTFQTIFPMHISRAISSDGSPIARGRSHRPVGTDQYVWFLVKHIPLNSWMEIQRPLRVQFLVALLLLTAGTLLGSAVIARAILRRKRADLELQKMNSVLERKVIERTAELNQEVQTRRQAEKVAHEAHAELQSIFVALGDGLIVLDVDGNIVHTNPAAQQFLRSASGEIVGRQCCDVMTEEACHSDQCPLEKLRTGERRVEHESEKILGDGTLRTSLVTAVPRLDENGEIHGFIFSIKDVSEWKRVLSENQSLEEQLRQAQKLEAVGTLAGGIAHDFNNILMVIIGNIDFALEELDEHSESASFLENALRAGKRAKDLVRQILTFSRKNRTEREHVFWADIIDETVKFLTASLPASIIIRTEVAEGLAPVLADPVSLQQIVLNLCTNAAQAMAEGGEIKISCSAVEMDAEMGQKWNLQPGKYQKVSVADTGEGMTEETAARIFEPFFTTKAPGQGTGLGLSVVHGIARSHGGTIEVRSQPGMGSVFNVFIAESYGGEMLEPQPTAEIHAGGGQTILFVDDEKQLVDIGKKYFEKYGYHVVPFSSAEKAVAYIESRSFFADLVLTDCTMPHIQGFDLAQKVGTLNPNIPVVMYSGFITPDSEKRAREMGIKKILRKPLSGMELVREVQEVIDHISHPDAERQ